MIDETRNDSKVSTNNNHFSTKSFWDNIVSLNVEYGEKGFELLTVIDMGENNSNKYGKSSRYRYIFKKNEN